MSERFNGAAALTLRRSVKRVSAADPISRLQWGRSVNAAEMCRAALIECSGLWLQWGRSVNAAEIWVHNKRHQKTSRFTTVTGCIQR